jgi:hypothetical protein
MNNMAHAAMESMDMPSALPSSLLAAAAVPANATPASARRRRTSRRERGLHPATLKLEIVHGTDVVYAVHGTSAAFDGLEDKDELVRTMQRWGCDHLKLSPPSVLINCDVTHEECLNVVGKQLPAVESNKDANVVAVLKEPMGSQGQGIFFVKNAEEIHVVIEEHRQRAEAEPAFLDNLIEAKGRIPSWVLQAEVVPSLLIFDGRKFHIRTYVVAVENLDHPDLVDVFVYNRHEVRVAGVPVPPDGGTERDRKAYITNGALSTTTQRVLIDQVEELMSRNLKSATEAFVAETFGKHLLPDFGGRVRCTQLDNDGPTPIRKFAMAGLDLMVTEDNRLYLLEVNANPAAPRENTITEDFANHLKGFWRDLVNLVTDVDAPNFVPVKDILQQHGLLDS